MNSDLLEKLRWIKCVYCDIDGTINTPSQKISATTKKTVRKLMDNRYVFGLISGRHYLLARPQLKELKPNGLYVGLNGALVVDPKQNVVHKETFAGDLAKDLIQLLIRKNYSFLFLTPGDLYFFAGQRRANYDLMIQYVRSLAVAVKPVEIIRCNEFLEAINDICFFVIFGSNFEEELDGEFDRFKNNPDVDFAPGFGIAEVKPARIDKGIGLERIAQYYHLSLKEILVFGDSYNDIPMFKKAGCSVVMKQASQEVKKYAHYVTEYDNAEDGVAMFIEKYLLV